MTKNLKWRLSKLPTADEVAVLVRDGIITKEEAKEILFRADDERDTDSLKEEIKFLRGLVEKLSSGQTQTVYTYIYDYPRTTWITPYITWCGTSSGQLAYYSTGTTGTQTMYCSNSATGSGTDNLNLTYTSAANSLAGSGAAGLSATGQNFSEIKTF